MSFSRLWMGLISFLITLSVLIPSAEAQTNVIYVDVNSFCFTPCDGSSWELAYKNLPDAVAAANASSMVRPDIWVADFFLKYELANPINLVNANLGNIYGGFSGYGRSGRGNDETSVDQRNPDLYPVILTGDLALDNDPVGDTLTSFFIIGGNTDVGIYDIDLEFAKSDAIVMSSGGLTLNNVSISNADGSGINITGVGTGNNVAFTDLQVVNVGGDGIRINSGSTFTLITLNNVMISNTGGDGIYVEGNSPDLRMFQSTIENATGVGLHSQSEFSIRIEDSTITNNSGGIISTSGRLQLLIYRTLFTDNTRNGNGGALFGKSRNLQIYNSTFSGNTTTGSGGAIYLENIGSPQGLYFDPVIASTTIVNNHADVAAGAFASTASRNAQFSNTIVSGNTSGDDTECGTGGATSLGGNIIGSNGSANGCPSNGTGDQIPTEALSTLLHPLADNGGPTQTHAVVYPGLAFNSGQNSLVAGQATDQRGVARIVNGTIDVGAYELDSDLCTLYSAMHTLSVVNAVTDLITALECATTNGTPTTIDLGGQTIILDTSYADYNGATGLPQIITPLTIQNGTIERDTNAAQFRFLNVTTGGDLILDGITLRSASSAATGGALLVNNNGVATILASTLENNDTDLDGGAITVLDGNVAIISSSLQNNTSVFGGGALRTGTNASNITLINSVVANNVSRRVGGVIDHGFGTFTVKNSTFFNNRDEGDPVFNGSFMYYNGGTVTIENSIIWGHAAPLFGGFAPTITHSIVNGGYSGTGNLDADPSFANVALGDYTLQVMSPAINAADLTQLPIDTYDVDNDGDTGETLPLDANGDSRITYIAVDMGAYEYQPTAIGTDLNGDSNITPADGIFVVNRLGTSDPTADVDGDGDVDTTDVDAVLDDLGSSVP